MPPKSKRSASLPDPQIEHVDPRTLVPDPENPRTISPGARERLKRGIEEFGLPEPLIVAREDRMVIGGHQRLALALDLGLESVPVVFLEGLSPGRRRALNVLLNNPNAQGEWSQEGLRAILAQIQEDDLDLSLTGFSLEQAEMILAGDDWQVPEPKGEAEDTAQVSQIRVRCRMADEDAVRSADHEAIMRARGLAPIPVWTRTASRQTLLAMLDRSPWVAVGGMVRSQNPSGFAKLATQIAGPGRLHLLGRSGLRDVVHMRPRSVDSSTWVTFRKFASGQVWIGRGREVRLDLRKSQGRGLPVALTAALEGYGISGKDLVCLARPTVASEGSKQRYRLGIRTSIARGLAVRAKVGTTTYFACTAKDQITDIVEEMQALDRKEWECPPS